jgi:hypothetical protein
MAECNLEVLTSIVTCAINDSPLTDRGLFRADLVDGPEGDAYALSFPVTLRGGWGLSRSA